MATRVQRKLYDYGVIYTLTVNVRFIKNPAHIVKYVSLPTELTEWILEKDKYVYIAQDEKGFWFISRTPPEMEFKAYTIQRNNQMGVPPKFPEGTIKLDWTCGSDIIWVQTH